MTTLAQNYENPVVVVKTSAGILKCTDLRTGYIEYIPKDDWHLETSPSGFTILYWDRRSIVTVFDDSTRNNGSSIFGATTSAGVTAILAEEIAETEAGSSGPVSINPSSIASGIDSSVDIEAIKVSTSSSDAKLGLILSELQSSKSIADLLVQDSGNPTNFYIRREIYDDTLNVSVVELRNLDGSVASPSPILPVIPVKAKADIEIIETQYVAKVPGSGYSTGDSVIFARAINTETGASPFSVTFNSTTGGTIPVTNFADFEEVEDKQIEYLKTISESIVDGTQTTQIVRRPIVYDLVSQPLRVNSEVLYIPSLLSGGCFTAFIENCSVNDVAVVGVHPDGNNSINFVAIREFRTTVSQPTRIFISDIPLFGQHITVRMPTAGSVEYTSSYEIFNTSATTQADTKITAEGNALLVRTAKNPPAPTSRVSNIGATGFLGAGKRIRSLIVTNLNSTAWLLQMYDSATAIAVGANPIDQVVIPGNGTYFAGVSDYGEDGTYYGANPQFAFSGSASGFFAVSASLMTNVDYSFEVI